MTRYHTRDIAVRGGALRVGVWDGAAVAAGQTPARVVLAVHGITASHRSWQLVAQRLSAAPDVQVLAPDLRGRGRSRDLPGPWGMNTHADDLAAVLDAFGVADAMLVGHSMGAFVAVVFARRHPSRTSALVLVDGGIPLPPTPGVSAEQALQAALGPAADRLSMTFESRAAYREFWQAHPAFAADWSEAVADYVDYDLIGAPPSLRSSASFDAVAADAGELSTDGPVHAAWAQLHHDVIFLRAPRGLLGEPAGLYAPEDVAAWAMQYPGFKSRDVAHVNHYTITLGPPGADAVADAARHAMERVSR